MSEHSHPVGRGCSVGCPAHGMPPTPPPPPPTGMGSPSRVPLAFADVGLDKRQKRRARRRAALTPDVIEQSFTRGRKYVTRAWKRAMEAARRRADRLIEQPCSEGNCVELIDPDTGENTGGWGPVGCPCQGKGRS